jgi:hypothetical protein
MSLSTPRAELYLLAAGLASSSLRNTAWLEPYTWHLTLQEMAHPQHGLCPLLEVSPSWSNVSERSAAANDAHCQAVLYSDFLKASPRSFIHAAR